VIQAYTATAKTQTSRETDPLDYDLWVAGQSITAARQERHDVLGALGAANHARLNLERHIASLQKKYDALVLRYNEIYKFYEILHGRHGEIQGECSRLCTKLKKSHENQSELEGVRAALDKEKSLRSAAELEVERLQGELATLNETHQDELQSRDNILEELADDVQEKSTELESRDNTIEALRQDIKDKDAAHTRLEDMLEMTRRQMKDVLQTLRDYEAKTAEVARLHGEITAREVALEHLQDEVATLTSKNESATRTIEGLKVVQQQMKDSHILVVQQLESENNGLKTENNDLNGALDKVADSNFELGGEIEASEKEKRELQEENASLRTELEAVRDVLLGRFPGLNTNLDNLSLVLEGNETGRKRRKRKCAS